ncbi:CD209 antigen-like protein E isoform X2 [Anguilla rostrata]|uniref:CD209 antigen-like protein E isoform X2 n=1 Tax=Anguilla rostrata TaxID=7938 RepID=UPI0030CBF62E
MLLLTGSYMFCISMVRDINGPSNQIYRLSAMILGILCAVLMAVIIGLCISYKGLSEKHIFLSQNSSVANSNLKQLLGNYDLLTTVLMKVQTSYQETVNARDSMQRERDRDRQEKELLQEHKKDLMNEQTKLQTRVTALEKNCERCPAGWELLHSSCYFFPPTDAGQKLTWQQSREECKKSGADLAEIDSQEKQEFISGILIGKRRRPGHTYTSGYWIGLRDVETEGVWKWLNGTALTQGYWFDGEPNDSGSEDCAATYPYDISLKTWNDAPCDFVLKWICEIKLQEP